MTPREQARLALDRQTLQLRASEEKRRRFVLPFTLSWRRAQQATREANLQLRARTADRNSQLAVRRQAHAEQAHADRLQLQLDRSEQAGQRLAAQERQAAARLQLQERTHRQRLAHQRELAELRAGARAAGAAQRAASLNERDARRRGRKGDLLQATSAGEAALAAVLGLPFILVALACQVLSALIGRGRRGRRRR